MRFIALAIVLMAGGCYTPYWVRPGEVPPATATVPPEQRNVTWQRSVGVLLEEGYVPQVLNEGACYVSGRQRDDAENGVLAGSMAIVTIAPDGLLRVEVAGRGLYLSQDHLNTDVRQLQAHLLRRILNQPELALPPPPPGAS